MLNIASVFYLNLLQQDTENALWDFKTIGFIDYNS